MNNIIEMAKGVAEDIDKECIKVLSEFFGEEIVMETEEDARNLAKRLDSMGMVLSLEDVYSGIAKDSNNKWYGKTVSKIRVIPKKEVNNGI